MTSTLVLALTLLSANGTLSTREKEQGGFSNPATRAAVEEDITGIYMCEGENPDGGKYQGIVSIEKNGRAFTVTWLIGRGGQPVSGVGVRNGNSLSASYVVRLNQGIGVAVVGYRIENGRKLIGRYTALGGDGTVRTETLTFMKKLE
jgi:hypothetical protein